MNRDMQPLVYMVYPAGNHRVDEEARFTSREEAFAEAEKRANEGRTMNVDASRDDFVTYRPIVQFSASPVEDIL